MSEPPATDAAFHDSDETYRILFELESDAIFLIDNEAGQILEVNPAASTLYGYSRAELLAKRNVDLSAEPEDTRAATQGQQPRVPVRYHRKQDGTVFPVETTARHFVWRGRDAHIAAIRDITHRQRAEAALVRRTRQLETVRGITAEITRELDLTALLRLMARRVAELVDASHGLVFLWDESAGLLRPLAWHGYGPDDESWLAGLTLRSGEGVAGTVAERRTGLIVNDYRTSPFGYPAALARTAIATALAEPLLYRDRLIGVFLVNRTTPECPFTEADRDSVALLATHAAIAIENARLHQTALQRGTELEAVLRATHTVMSGLDLQAILDRIVAETARISRCSHVKVLLVERDAGVLRVGAIQGTAMREGDRLPVGVGHSGIVARTGEPLYVADAPNDPNNAYAAGDRELGIVTFLGLPIKSRGEVLGVLSFNTMAPRHYRAEELTYLQVFADQAAIAIENARLYASARSHADALEVALADLRELDRLKSAFLANVSHELRSPLTPILGYLSALRNEDCGPLTAPQRQALDAMAMSADRLHQLIEDLLLFAERETGQLSSHRAAVAVAALIEMGGARAVAGAREKGVRIVMEIPADLPPIWAHPDALSRALGHVIENAVKFTPARGTVTVTAQRGGAHRDPAPALRAGHGGAASSTPQASGEHVEVTVRDEGIGIPPDLLPRIFDRFYQVDGSWTREYGGYGARVGAHQTARGAAWGPDLG
jgi:PAS domain S-box-containing protein